MGIAVITVVKNDTNGLYKTFKSIRQHLKDISTWVIVDGGNGSSIDNQIYEESEKSKNIHIVSGFDAGIYNAMNIGASYVSDDDYIWWINAGDELYKVPNVEKNVDVVFYNVYIKEKNKAAKLNVKNWNNGKGLFPVSVFWHQGFVIKKNVFDKYLYNESLSMASDLLLMSLCQKNERYIVVDLPIAIYALDGVSNKNYIKWIKEYMIVVSWLGISKLHMPYKSYVMIIKMIVKKIISLF